MVPGVGEDSFKNWICFSKLLLLKHSHASDLRDSLLEASSLWKNEDSQDGKKKRERNKKKEKDEVGRSKNNTMLLVYLSQRKPKPVSCGSKRESYGSNFEICTNSKPYFSKGNIKICLGAY